jgi:hypothetical protein
MSSQRALDDFGSPDPQPIEGQDLATTWDWAVAKGWVDE